MGGMAWPGQARPAPIWAGEGAPLSASLPPAPLWPSNRSSPGLGLCPQLLALTMAPPEDPSQTAAPAAAPLLATAPTVGLLPALAPSCDCGSTPDQGPSYIAGPLPICGLDLGSNHSQLLALAPDHGSLEEGGDVDHVRGGARTKIWGPLL